MRCCVWQVAPAWGPLVAEGVLLGLLLLNLGLPCYYSGARDYLSRRIHQLECDGRGGGGRRAGREDSRRPSPSLTPATARALALTLTVTSSGSA